MPNEKDVLRYGKVLTDDMLEDTHLNYNYRIRTINYQGIIFYHKMVNGETVEFEVLCL